MRIVSIGEQVHSGDYSKWRVVLEHGGKEIADWFYYGGVIEAVDSPPVYPELRSKTARTIRELIRELEYGSHGDIDKVKAVKLTPEMEMLADEIVNKVLHDKGKL